MKRQPSTRDEQVENHSTPAYFTQLTVENIRCFGPKQYLDLSDGQGRPAQWTVLLGDNGTGKTTLLQCLAGMDVEAYASHSGDSWYARVKPEWLERASRLSDYEEGNVAVNAVVAVTGSLSRSGEVLSSHPIEVNYNPDVGFSDMRAASWMSVDSLVGEILCCGYGATRRMRTTSLADVEEVDGTASLFDDDISLINAEEWLIQADYVALRPSPIQKQAQERRDRLKALLVELLPDVSDIRFTGEWNPGVQLATPYGWVGVQDLSLGYRSLIAWIVDLAYRLFERYPNSTNPLAEPAIVLVDEIDLHLHPKWQRSLMSYLSERFPNTQFIATAHSPLIVQAATDANIALLRREGDHVVIDNDVEAIRGWRIDQVLTSDLFGLDTARPPEFDDLLKERNSLLGKSKLTKKDERRLKELDALIGDLPTGETPEDIEAMDIIRSAAEALKQEREGAR